MADRDFVCRLEDFFGSGPLADGDVLDSGLVVTASGTGTLVSHLADHGGAVALMLGATDEAQLVAIGEVGAESVDWTKLNRIEFRLRSAQEEIDPDTEIFVGLAALDADSPEDLDAAPAFLLFRMKAGTAGVVVAESKDTSVSTTGAATGQVLSQEWMTLEISLASGLRGAQMIAGGQHVAGKFPFTAFKDEAGKPRKVQPIVAIAKASGVSADGIDVDYIRLEARR